MAKSRVHLHQYRYIILTFLMFLLFIPLILAQIVSTSSEKAVTQSKAAFGKTITVSDFTGDAIKQAVDSAQSGDTIVFPPGTYQGPTAIPEGLGDSIAVTADRGGATTCFVRIDHKDITIEGKGAILYGEGHSRPYQDPYQTRGGLCVLNGSHVTVDGLRLKEFQKRCAVVYNSTVIVKNSTIDGCDEGGYSLLGNSAGLFVNNNFSEMNFGGVMLWQNSQAKIVNNIFFDAAVLFFYHGDGDHARADIINNIFSSIKSDVAQVDWWKATGEQIKSNKLSYNLIYRSADQTCDPSFQFWCDAFPGKITADPMYTAPVTDPTGIAAWADFTLKSGSPAIGVGDPSIPGPKNLGLAGGPCADPSSSTCSTFIQSNTPQPYAEPTPTAVPTPVQESQNQNLSGSINYGNQSTNLRQVIYTSSEIGPLQNQKATPIYNNVFPGGQTTSQSGNQGTIFIQPQKKITVLSVVTQGNVQPINKTIAAKQSMEFPLKTVCGSQTSTLDIGLAYRSSTDASDSLHYVNVIIQCGKSTVVSVE